MTKSMVMDNTLGLTGGNMQVCGKTESRMARESTKVPTIKLCKEYGRAESASDGSNTSKLIIFYLFFNIIL